MDLTSVGTSAQGFWAGINWAQPSWDLFIIMFFIIAAFLYGLSLGRDRIIVIMVSIYMALAIVSAAPFLGPTTTIALNTPVVIKISVFLGLFVLLFFFLSRSALLRTIASSDDKGKWYQVLLYSILHVGLLVSVTLNYLPSGAVEKLAPLTRAVFASQNARFAWILAPIIAMALFGGAAKEKKKFKYEV
jgi:peptidoglycan/LPS O-acetylase OafA/YrhL